MMEDPSPSTADTSRPGQTSERQAEDARAEAAALSRQLVECRQRAEEQAARFRLADEELQHRARNTMALVRSAFKRTVDTGKSLEDVEMHFCGRLDVLNHYMLPRSARSNEAVDLETLVRNELRSFQFGDAPGITIKGSSAELSLEQAQPFALAIHELVTNALKFGALSGKNDAGLNVTWRVRDGRLTLAWTETGVPMVACAPVHRGFGLEFIEEALPYQIGATTRFERQPGGLVCTIELALGTSRAARHLAKGEEG